MNKSVIIKLAVILIVPILVLTVALYFLYPYLNEEKYQQIVGRDSVATSNYQGLLPDTLRTDMITGELPVEMDTLIVENRHLLRVVDSLRTANDTLRQQLEESRKKQDTVDQQSSGQEAIATVAGNKQQVPAETFAERVKSLLNLETRELSPIINQMDDKQIVRLYRGASSMQREKLLRSLKPERAAKLMSEIML